jgi:carboxyl-terminal processing protease
MKFKKIAASILTAAMAFTTLAVPTSAYDYDDYKKDYAASGMADEVYSNYELAMELAEVVSADFKAYWDVEDKTAAFWDGLDLFVANDDEFFVAYMKAIVDFVGDGYVVPFDEESDRADVIDAQLDYAKGKTGFKNVRDRVLPPLINDNDDYFNSLTYYIIQLTDEYGKFITAEEYYAGQDESSAGLGVSVQPLGTSVLIISVVPGSGADLAGIVPGDVILAVDGKGFNTDDPNNGLETFGEAGTTLDVTILREDSTIETVTVTRAMFSEGKVVAERLSKDTMSITFGAFVLMSDAYAFEKYYDYAVSNPDITKLVIDLRGNGGGDSEVMNAICSVMTPEGTQLYKMTGKQMGIDVDDEYTSAGKYKGNGVKFDGTIFVLTDMNSASASDVLTGVIKNVGGIQVGETSYGKGIGQGGYLLHNGYMAWVTALYVDMPNFGQYHGKGFEPDVPIASTKPAFADGEILPLDTSAPLTADSDPDQIKAYQQRLMALGADIITPTGVLDERTIWLTNVLLYLYGADMQITAESGIPVEVLAAAEENAAYMGYENIPVSVDDDPAMEYCINYTEQTADAVVAYPEIEEAVVPGDEDAAA